MTGIRFITAAAAIFAAVSLYSQTTRELKPACDSMTVLMEERTGVKSELKLKRVTASGNSLQLRFTKDAGNYPWRESDVEWFKETFPTLFPENYQDRKIGNIFVENYPISDYVMPLAGSNGRPVSTRFRTDKDPRLLHPFIEEKDGMNFSKGLSGRNIALWQSHGRYYEAKTDRWEWQRAPLFQTVEDLYTQSYVLPFLIPMLENAGAYVMTPRERDIQTHEIIADNDPAFTSERGMNTRTEGKYSEKGSWEDAGVGFADSKAVYTLLDNPFRMGTVRMTTYREKDAMATWTPDIRERGSYAVYISYKSLPNSTQCAHYTVRFNGGEKEFYVNQRMGGGTWIYLGTFEFDEGTEGCVTLDTKAPEGRMMPGSTVLTADAVRFGGGMGKIGRGLPDQPADEYVTSGMPSYMEGALYWMQWAGADSTLLTLHEDDYTSDYADRGAWVGWMSGGSKTNPNQEGLGIPIDLSLGFHTDAGTAQADSTIGTLAIYTLKCDGSDKLPNGEPRLQARMLCDFTQTQIVNDVRSEFDPEWRCRGIWDRSYSESRTTTVPGMLLELLSHQNFADMKYGLDPSFRFTVSRAVYKGILKYLSNRYGFNYAVQPLPVNSFAVSFRNMSSVELSWDATIDSLEETAVPKGYIVYTRIDDGPFDQGTVVNSALDHVSIEKGITAGHIYSYKVVAFNEGGKSFPSEILSIGVPKNAKDGSVLVVNNFTRVAPPAWFDTPDYAGFSNDLDAGVPYIQEINFLGEQYEFRRNKQWVDDDNPGFGASFTNMAGKTVIGNTFDYPYIHGKSIMAAGHPFHSASTAAFQHNRSLAQKDFAIDLICGKQITTRLGSGLRPNRYQVFPVALQDALKASTADGKNLFVTGANIGTDVCDSIYPLKVDSLYTVNTKAFLHDVLGFDWLTSHATKEARVEARRFKDLNLSKTAPDLDYYNQYNNEVYCVERSDGITPASDKTKTVLRYTDTEIPAATAFSGEGYRTVCIGFPFETIKNKKGRDSLMECVLEYFGKK